MDKKNFFIYTDKSEQINLLSDEQAGILFKALFTYVVNKTELTTTDKLIQLVFIAMRNDIDRDSAKYDSICEKRRLAGIEGNKKRWNKELSQKSQMLANAKTLSQSIANVADNNNNNDNNNDIIKKERKKKDELSFDQRQKYFKDSLVPYVELYGKPMIRAFFDYWSEPTQKGIEKMRYELEKTWKVESRLRTWERRQNNGK